MSYSKRRILHPGTVLAKENTTIKDKGFFTGNSTIYDVETYSIQMGYRTSRHEL